MITRWNQFCAQIEATDAKLNEFIETSGLSSLQLKKLQKFTSEWNKTKNLANDFDTFLSPVDPIKVESPFDQEDFRYIWKTWKEYLTEEHGILIRSRREQMSLEYLAEISDNNVDVAINYLRFAMGNGYRKFFIVTQQTKSTPEKVDKDGSNW